MPVYLIIFCITAFVFRVGMLVVSRRHERALKREGAVEIGAGNTLALTLAHVTFYVAAISEGSFRQHPLDPAFWLGAVLYSFGAIMLVVVARLLGRLWTVKLLLARDHELVEHPLFRRVRHPNYFLNILPELVGFGLLLNAQVTLFLGLPIYLVPLVVRIRQEEAAMRERFRNY